MFIFIKKRKEKKTSIPIVLFFALKFQNVENAYIWQYRCIDKVKQMNDDMSYVCFINVHTVYYFTPV